MQRQLTILGLTGYLFIGTAAVLVPSIMPAITDEFMRTGLTLAAIGLIFPARSAGGILGNLLAGVGSDLMGRSRLVWLSALILAFALTLTAATRLWVFFLLGFLVISAAQGSLATGINAMVTDANRDARARALNTLHSVYGAGAAISPLVIGYLLDRGLGWRWALAGTGVIWLAYALLAYILGNASRATGEPEQTQRPTFGMIREGAILALFLIAFIYNGVAYSLLGWIAVFMQQSAGYSTFLSVAMISVFYVALTIGRVFCAAFAERLGYAATILVLGVGITVTYPLVVLGIDSPWAVVAGVFLTGLSLSGLFPMALAYGSRLYPEQAGTITGILSVAMTFGAMIPPLWTGVIADRWGLQVALGANYVLVPPLILLAYYLRRKEADQHAAMAIGAQTSPETMH